MGLIQSFYPHLHALYYQVQDVKIWFPVQERLLQIMKVNIICCTLQTTIILARASHNIPIPILDAQDAVLIHSLFDKIVKLCLYSKFSQTHTSKLPSVTSDLTILFKCALANNNKQEAIICQSLHNSTTEYESLLIFKHGSYIQLRAVVHIVLGIQHIELLFKIKFWLQEMLGICL